MEGGALSLHIRPSLGLRTVRTPTSFLHAVRTRGAGGALMYVHRIHVPASAVPYTYHVLCGTIGGAKEQSDLLFGVPTART